MPFPIKFKDLDVEISNQTIIMAILNVSPESPIDHSITSPKHALKRAEILKKEGATIIDVGGNSSASTARLIPIEEEISRVIPIIDQLVNENFIVSLDSWTAVVAEEAAKAGVHLLNDINGLQNPDMIKIAQKYDIPVCIMHMRGEPKGHYDADQKYTNITNDIFNWFDHQISNLVDSYNIKREKLIIDPGFEFGKSMEDNLQLLWEMPRFREFNLPILISTSRKAFIAESIGLGKTQKGNGILEATLAVQALSAYFGAQILRVHDVKEVSYVVKFINKLKQVAAERKLL